MSLFPSPQIATVSTAGPRIISPRGPAPSLPPEPPTGRSPRGRGRLLHKQSGAFRGRPIHLTASCIVQPNASNSPNNQALHSPVLSPIEITHIKFGYNMLVPGSAPSASALLALDGMAILAQISLNDDLITNGYVPFWSFDESTNLANEQTAGYNSGAGTATSPYQTVIYGEFIWKLPFPLYVRPADQINVSFQNLGQQALSVTCRISMHGCVLENTTDPKTRIIPFVAFYQSIVFNSGSASTDQSSETALANTTDDVIHLQKLTGRVDNYQQFNSTGAYLHYDDPNFSSSAHTLGDSGDSLLVQAYTGRGTQLIPYNSTFRDLFGPARAVPLCGVLEPGDYIIAALSGASPTTYAQAGIGMTAWREVALQ